MARMAQIIDAEINDDDEDPIPAHKHKKNRKGKGKGKGKGKVASITDENKEDFTDSSDESETEESDLDCIEITNEEVRFTEIHHHHN